MQKHVAKILKVSVSLRILFWVMCLLFMDIVDTSGTIVVDYMVEKLGIEKSKIEDLSNLLYKNYGTTMAGLRVCMIKIFNVFNSLLKIGINCWILITYACFCFIVNAGNWIWLWLWRISQVQDLFSDCFYPIWYSYACFVVVYWFLNSGVTVLFMEDYLMRTWNQIQFWGTFCWACPIGN